MMISPSKPEKVLSLTGLQKTLPLALAAVCVLLGALFPYPQRNYFNSLMPSPLLEPFVSRRTPLWESLRRLSGHSNTDWTEKANLYSEAVRGAERLGPTRFEMNAMTTAVNFEFLHKNFQTRLFAATRAQDKDLRKGIGNAVKNMELVAASQADIVCQISREEEPDPEQVSLGVFKGEVNLFEIRKGRYEVKIKNEFVPKRGDPVIYLEHFLIQKDDIEQTFSGEKMAAVVHQFGDILKHSRTLLPQGTAPGFGAFSQDFFSELLKNMPQLIRTMIEEYPMARERYRAELKVMQLEEQKDKNPGALKPL